MAGATGRARADREERVTLLRDRDFRLVLGAGSSAQTTWGVGEYALMAERLMPVAEAVVERANVHRGDRVLDVACGTGNVAVLAAQRGAHVVGVDFEPRLLALARARSGPEIEWRQCDVTAMAVESGAFDVVASVFGVMYAFDHAAAAAELRRVCRPGGQVVVTAWTPGSFMPSLGGAVGPFLPPLPDGAEPPTRWGSEKELQALYERCGLELEDATRQSVELGFATVEMAVDVLLRSAGHVMAERDRLERGGAWDELTAKVGELVRASSGGGNGARLQLDYLLSIARGG